MKVRQLKAMLERFDEDASVSLLGAVQEVQITGYRPGLRVSSVEGEIHDKAGPVVDISPLPPQSYVVLDGGLSPDSVIPGILDAVRTAGPARLLQ